MFLLHFNRLYFIGTDVVAYTATLAMGHIETNHLTVLDDDGRIGTHDPAYETVYTLLSIEYRGELSPASGLVTIGASADGISASWYVFILFHLFPLQLFKAALHGLLVSLDDLRAVFLRVILLKAVHQDRKVNKPRGLGKSAEHWGVRHDPAYRL
jgi:hypothetical protein